MAKIQAKRGLEANLGSITLADGEFAVTTDTKKLYVGVAGAKICLGGASSLGDMLKSIYDTDNDGIVDNAENADTVDGKHASDFAPSGYGLGTTGKRLAANTDLNTVKSNGWYDVPTPVNGPYSGSWVKLLVVASADSNYVTQMAFGMAANYIGITFTRTLDAGTWGSWSSLYSTLNKPTASDIGAMKKGPVTWNDLEGV